jgi:phage-related minor tail protein
MTEEVRFILSADDSKSNAALKRTEDQLKKVASATQLTKSQMQQLNFQLTDIVTGLASGQSPFIVLMQQGGQLKDMFGGVGGAARAVASVFTATRLAALGLAGGVTAVAAAAIQGWQESNKLRDAIALTGNAAGITEGRFRSLTERIAQTSTATIGDSREITMALVASGRIGGGALEAVARAATLLQRATGASADDIVRDFTRMQGGIAKWAAEANERYHFLNIETFKLIQQQEKLGHTQEAMRIAAEALAKPLEKQQQNLGLLERAWLAVNKAASQAWDSMLNVGRADTIDQQIEKVRKLIEANSRRTDFEDSVGPNGMRKGANARGAELQLELASLMRQRRAQLGAADLASLSAMQNQDAIGKALNPQQTKQPPQDFLGDTIAGFQNRLMDWQSRDADAIAKWEEAVAGPGALDAMEEANQKRLEAWKETNEAMLDAARPEWEKLAEAWEDVTGSMEAVGKNFSDGFVDANRDAFQEFLRTGKVSMDSFKNLIVQTLTQLVYDRYIAKAMGQLGNNIFNYLQTGFGGGGWSLGSWGSGTDTGTGAGGYTDTGSAGYTTAAASSSSAASTRRSAASVQVNQTINVGAGASLGEVYAAMRTAKDAAVAEITDKVARGNRLYTSR